MRDECIIAILISLMGSLTACHSNLKKTALRSGMEASRAEPLESAIEAYFLAKTPDEMRRAVSSAKAAGASSGDYHFIAADLAMFENREADRFAHLVETIRDTDTQFSLLAIRYLWYMAWHFNQQPVAEALLTNVVEHHPDPRMRAFAAHALSHFLILKGNLEDAAQMADSIGWRLPFSVIGTWNNEQGKGFDTFLPPEEEVNLNRAYVGQFIETKWRQEPILTPTHELDLSELLYPRTWAIGYAVSSFEAKEKQALELRVSTSDAIKVWVNDRVVFSERKIQSSSYDTVVIPVSINKGINRIMVKMSQDGDATWTLSGRLTGENGATLKTDGFRKVPIDTPIAARDENTATPLDAPTVIAQHLIGQNRIGAVRAFAGTCWTNILGLASTPVEAAEAYVKAAPSSLRAKYTLAIALWNNQERAKANLLLSDLFEKHGSEFLEIALKQARFWDQNELDNKVKNLLTQLASKNPERVGVQLALSGWYQKKGWDEDRLFVMEEAYKKWPDDPTVIRELAACYQKLAFDQKSLELHDRILDAQPFNWTSLLLKYEYASNALDYKSAERAISTLLKAWPNDISLLAKLAELKRRQEAFDAAEKITLRIRAIHPDSPWAYGRLAHFAYYRKQTDAAVDLWKKGLARNPDDGDLEERLAYLVPTKPEPWRKDIPTREHMMNAVAMRNTISPHPGANTVLILDNAVAKLNTDGSSIGVITSVVHSTNTAGRDAITTHRIGCGGRSKVLTAFSVSPGEQVTEASSIDGNVIRFRGLEVGSTIAVQSRCEASPDALIGNYFSTDWAFQGNRSQFVDSRYTLYAEPNANIKEFVRGEIKREESIVGDHKRISWSAMHPPILIPEPNMPPRWDVIWRLKLSTVPNWREFYNWEEALLIDAFRQSPEIVELAERLFKGVETKEEILKKIQTYLSEDIRYKQEYENPIAGVKPHPSPMVLSRGYGDCKDKTVFFITLAKLADIEARFALLRTRGAGSVTPETPAQQFNHAIVYVPKQEGISKSRFYDPTADGLDVDIIRSDVPGVHAMVLDLEKKSFDWVSIPFNDAKEVFFHRDVNIKLERDGGATGSIIVSSKGYSAAQVRLISRNHEQFTKVLEVLANEVFPGATLDDPSEIDVQDVNQPIHFEIAAKTKTFARVTDKELSFKIPFSGNLSKSFVIDERTYPLILGVPSTASWQIAFHLPPNSKVVRTPKPYEMNTECISFDRTVKRKKGQILVDQKIRFLCERIPVELYPNHRTEIQKLRQALEDNVVIKQK